MARNQWFSRLLAGTRGRLLARLRRAPATIAELTHDLTLSANAVRSHLNALGRDGLVEMQPMPRKGAGKPAHQFRLTAGAATLTPKAYDTLLDTVLVVARERAGSRGYAQILKAAAAKIAGHPAAKAEFNVRLADTKALLATIGAEVEIRRRSDKLRLLGTDCPLASIVGAHPELCGVLADVIGRRLGVPVKECCDRSSPLPRCCFEAHVFSAT